jgi:hypothetical protein
VRAAHEATAASGQARSAGAAPLARSPEEQLHRAARSAAGTDGTRPRAAWTLADGAACRGGEIACVVQNLETGEARPRQRAPAMTFDQAVAAGHLEATALHRQLWSVAAGRPSAPLPSAPLERFGRLRRSPARTDGAAWASAWATDAQNLRERYRRSCGRGTRVIVRETATGERWTSTGPAWCGRPGCLACARAIVAPRETARLEASAGADNEPWTWATFTLDPAAWCAAQGVPMTSDAAILAQRWAGPAWAALLRRLRRRFPDLEAYRAIEPHRSGWPHVHVILRGASLAEAVADEARRRGLAPAASSTHQAHQAAADDAAAQRRAQLVARAAGRKRRARCPTPSLRRWFRLQALDAGFGPVLDLTAVQDAGRARVAGYAGKGPAGGRSGRLNDRGRTLRPGLARETAKPAQRTGALLARGVRWFQATRGFFPAVDDAPDHADRVVSVASLAMGVAALRAALEPIRALSGSAVQVDFRAAPVAGQALPRVDAGFVLAGDLLGGILAGGGLAYPSTTGPSSRAGPPGTAGSGAGPPGDAAA